MDTNVCVPLLKFRPPPNTLHSVGIHGANYGTSALWPSRSKSSEYANTPSNTDQLAIFVLVSRSVFFLSVFGPRGGGGGGNLGDPQSPKLIAEMGVGTDFTMSLASRTQEA